MLMQNVEEGLWWSVGVTLVALFVFGYMKGRFTGIHPLKGAAQTTLIGGLAAAVAFGLARAVSVR
jgi:VIT1/CCC1 family predicted Fe2+/Mn2+ transporter